MTKTIKVTKKQFQKIVKEASEKKNNSSKGTIKITSKELKEKVRSIVESKLQEMNKISRVPAKAAICEDLGYSKSQKQEQTVVTESATPSVQLTDRQELAVKFAKVLTEKKDVSVKDLEKYKSVAELTEADFQKTEELLKEWYSSKDDSILEVAKETLAQK
jgi:hypothetical protein